ncbi:M23 family metallopeptidase [Microbacterium sp.]|uniref:M23 family metallopeptidase n=1 Tax=Microbacterium sp. TaxID=51671 RepID=UPI003C77F580
MTPDTPSANAPRVHSAAERPAAADAAKGLGVMTRAEYRRLAAAAAASSGAAAETSHPALIEPALAEPAVAEAVPADDAPETLSLAESVVADVAAAIVAETAIGAQPDAASRRRLREAARAVFEAVADETAVPRELHAGVASHAAERATLKPAAEVPVIGQMPAASAFVTRPATSEATDRLVDEFEIAARLFSFAGEMPAQRPVVDGDLPVAGSARPARPTEHVAPRRARLYGGGIVKRMAAASVSLGVMTIVGLLAVGTTTPAAAVAAVSDGSADLTVAAAPKPTDKPEEIQAFVASGDTGADTLDRPESYNVASMAEIAADSGVTIFAGTWVNDPSAAIQWPFPVGVPISAAYGSISYLSQFSTPHRGVDLTPGLGAEVHAVAAGTVRIATEAGGDYGVTVLIDHIIDGQVVSTRYGHMQYGSLRVKQGDTVTAGEVIGTVGQTGKATGPHLHLEVLLGGTTHTDPISWLTEHTTGAHTVG